MNDQARTTARRHAVTWARGLLDRRDWLVLDCESTSLGPDAEVLQVGLVAPDGSVLLDGLAMPLWPVSAEASAVHGIDQARLDKERPCDYWTMHPRLVRALHEARRVVVYNAGFDVQLLQQTAARWGLGCPLTLPGMEKPGSIPTTCAMLAYAEFLAEWSNKYGSWRWHKLPPLPGAQAHDAVADARATLALIHEMAEG